MDGSYCTWSVGTKSLLGMCENCFIQEAKKGRKQCKNQIVNKSQVEEDEMCIDVGNRENNFVLVSII